MSDVFTKSKRSAVLSQIRGRGNKATELALVKLFRRRKVTGWQRKIFRNQPRHKEVNRTLRKFGWRVFRIWQPVLKRKNEPRVLRKLHRALATACSMA